VMDSRSGQFFDSDPCTKIMQARSVESQIAAYSGLCHMIPRLIRKHLAVLWPGQFAGPRIELNSVIG
jgi:hypothetical protein